MRPLRIPACLWFGSVWLGSVWLGSVWLGCLTIGCAGAAERLPDAPAERVLLREQPEVGEQYLTHFELRFSVYGRVVRVRRQLLSTVVAADVDGALFDHRFESGGFDLLDPRLVLAPSRDPLVGTTIRERRDRRGRRAGNLQLTEGDAAQRAQLSANAIQQLIGAPALPEQPLLPQGSWTGPGRWAYRVGMGAPVEGEREVTYHVRTLSGSHVTLALAGELRTADNRLAVEGELEVDTQNALLTRGHLVGTIGEGDGGPTQYRMTWRTQDAAGASRDFEGDPGDDVPRSRLFEGETCGVRVRELARRMDLAPTGMRLSTEVEVPNVAVARDVPWGSLLELREGGFVLEGHALDLTGAVEGLETLARNRRVLQPGREGRVNVLVVAPADLPFARLSALAAGLAEDSHALFLVVRTADAPSAPPRFAPGTPPAIESLAQALEPGELASLAVGTCSPLIESYGQAANMEPAAVWLHHRVTVPAALRACECRGTDVDLVDALLMSTATVDRDPRLRVLPLPADLGALRLRRRATVSDLASALAP